MTEEKRKAVHEWLVHIEREKVISDMRISHNNSLDHIIEIIKAESDLIKAREILSKYVHDYGIAYKMGAFTLW